MDASNVRDSLCEVISEIQTISGLDCPPLSGGTTPVGGVKDFSSEIWPIAISMLEEKIGVEIPDDENLFYDAKTKVALTIDQCVEKVMMLPKNKKEDTTDE